jgi:hypothetical protein
VTLGCLLDSLSLLALLLDYLVAALGHGDRRVAGRGRGDGGFIYLNFFLFKYSLHFSP